MTAPHGSLVAVVPIRSLSGAKSRLGGVLDAEEREQLVADLLRRTITALAAAPSVTRTIVISEDDGVLTLTRELGATALRDLGGGLNASLDQARAAALDLGAGSLLVIPGDLPAIAPDALEALVAAALDAPSVTLIPDRHGSGTNALLLDPPGVIPFSFGPESRSRHRRLAIEAGARFAELEGPLALDVDTAEDLLAAATVEGMR